MVDVSQRYQAAPKALVKKAAAKKAKAGRRELEKRGRLGACCSTLLCIRDLGQILARRLREGYGTLREVTAVYGILRFEFEIFRF